jgi:hypothetical protein
LGKSDIIVTHKNVTLRHQDRGSLGRRAWFGGTASQPDPSSAPALSITTLPISGAVRHFASTTMPVMPRKRTHTDVVDPTQAHFCQRCRQQFPRGGGPSHLQITCVAVQAALHYKCNLEAHYFYDENYYTTPITAPLTDNTSSHPTVEEESDLSFEETTEDNSTETVPNNNTTPGSEMFSNNITTYLASLSGLDPEYILQCVNWLPRPTAITNHTRLALQFLSCTCSGDGTSKNHMNGILKFIKRLRGLDAALLPNSIETCWKQIEEVQYSFDLFTVTSIH